jgi:pyruvate-formate lyase-activating enzyme
VSCSATGVRYFIGVLDPCASIEFTRGCPWDCAFCSAWTFYGRSYRELGPERVVEDLARVEEPGVFIVDDVAFIQARHGYTIGEAIARRGIKKQYYLETRGDVLLRNVDLFKFWKTLGMRYMFLGIEAIDEEGLKSHRKRISLGKNFEALECARSLGIQVAINIIADPDWDRRRFEVVRQFCLEIPEIVNHQRQHPVSRHRDLAHRGAPHPDPRLPPLRHPACGAADTPAVARVLRGASQNSDRSQQEAPRLASLEVHCPDRGQPFAARSDELRQDAVEVQQRL